jgi:hypothetical protein
LSRSACDNSIVAPTFERLARFDREFRRLQRELQRAFLEMLP